jgi:hypothetical protein
LRRNSIPYLSTLPIGRPYSPVVYFGTSLAALVFAISRTKMSVAPTAVSSSITMAICFFSTIELTATQPSSSNALIVGARFPGVILVALERLVRRTLYWQRTYLCAAVKGERVNRCQERVHTDDSKYSRGDQIYHCWVGWTFRFDQDRCT